VWAAGGLLAPARGPPCCRPGSVKLAGGYQPPHPASAHRPI